MNHKDLDLVKLSTLTSHQIDHVTCLECCKYYIAPATAACGHTLCHTCWRGRRTCPVCAATLDRKTLKLNLQLQTLTQHVQTLGEAFEKLFNMKLNEFILDTPGELESEKNPNKDVTEWLASSQNHFSSPLMHSEQSTQGLQPVSNPLEISARNIQIHSEVKKNVSPPKVICVPPPQDDWDKIESMPDPDEGNKNKENIVGPMDIEPFFVDDTEYTLDRPRRSSRKKEIKNEDCILKTRDLPTSKHSSRDSSGDNEKKSEKNKQTWNNVKKMRKEFSKLNKINKSKLNVSIEMVKKTQSFKPTNATPAITQQFFNIDDNTPDNANKGNEIDKTIKEGIVNQDTQSCKIDPNSSDYNKIVEKSHEDISVEYNNDNKNLLIASDAVVHDKNNKEHVPQDLQENTSTMKTYVHNKVYPAHSKINKNQNSKSEETSYTKMPFIKKSALLPKHEDISIKTNNNDTNAEQASVHTDDIEITIKIGNTITNIVIKKKESVQVKVNTDREVQTSLGNYGLSDEQQSSDDKIRNVEINLNSDLFKTPVPSDIIQNRCANVQTDPILDKSASTKKNTASAETATATAQFEITESVEKELSNIMECEETSGEEHVTKDASRSSVKQTIIHATQIKHKNIVESELDDLNDLDIFGSGSVKETNVQMLKEPAPSEILVSTVHSKYKTQKIAEKRERDNNDDDALPNNKKIKITEEKKLTENVEPDSELINYDAVMGQVFANIDADIEDIRKSQSVQNTNTATENKIKNVAEQPKYIISQTQTQINEHHSNVTNVELASQFNQKHSEMVFSMIEKDDENSEVIKKYTIPQQVEELLTPGLCRNLNVSQESHEAIDKTCKSRRKSLQDNYDSDKSIEETPQKNILIPKLKRASTSHRELNNSQALIETKKIPSSSVIGNKSVINLTDTLAESSKSSRDITVVDTAAKRITLETPLTISKFTDQIKHKSTPVARKSLNFENENHDDDPDQTLCPSSAIAKTTQEKEFLRKAFEKTPTSTLKSVSTRSVGLKPNKKLCLAGSCLSPQDTIKIKYLCNERNWTYVDKYTKDLTHLVVGVDEENKSQRSVKYMCALAASKWIVSFEWVDKCLLRKDFVDEEHFEALDSTGEPGPRRSRTAKNKLFEGIKFYCMPPFSVLDVDTLKSMLVAAGGRVVNDIKDVRALTNSCEVSLLLAEPEHTQEDRFIYLTMELSVVPVNYEWVLNCLGCYNLGSIHELLLCPSSLLPPATAGWPEVLLAQEYD